MQREAKPVEMSIVEAKKHFTQILRKLNKPLTVTRHGEPVAVILSLQDYDRLSRTATYHQILELRKRIPKNTMTATEAYRISRKELEDRAYRH